MQLLHSTAMTNSIQDRALSCDLPEALLLAWQCHQAAPAGKFLEIHWESLFLMPCGCWLLVLPAQQQYLQDRHLPIDTTYKADT